jgi:hypothetical protein
MVAAFLDAKVVFVPHFLGIVTPISSESFVRIAAIVSGDFDRRREGGVTAAEMRAWVKSIVDRIPRGDYRQNKFKSFVQMSLMHALGRKSEFPRDWTVGQVLDSAAASVNDPSFVPKYDRSLRLLDWPERN